MRGKKDMKEFQRAKQAVGDIEYQLKQTVKALQDMEDGTSRSELNDNELMQYYAFWRIKNKLEDALAEIEYLKKPVVAEGTLYKNEQGRYEIDHLHYFTSGSPIEIYIYDDFEERYYWYKSRVEHKDGDYYVVGYDGPLEGLKARIRG
jgi:hypothetical protein